MYGAAEIDMEGDAERTRANARDPDATIRSGKLTSPGGRTTVRDCAGLGRPVFPVTVRPGRQYDMVAWIVAEEVRTLNVARNRERIEPGIGERAGRFLVAASRQLRG